jgi:hypothetical protein
MSKLHYIKESLIRQLQLRDDRKSQKGKRQKGIEGEGPNIVVMKETGVSILLFLST